MKPSNVEALVDAAINYDRAECAYEDAADRAELMALRPGQERAESARDKADDERYDAQGELLSLIRSIMQDEGRE